MRYYHLLARVSSITIDIGSSGHMRNPVTFWLYGVLYCTLLAAAFPFVTVSMNTLFSKILGPRRQGTMQGIMLMAGSLARVVGPLVVSSLFQLHGPVPVWSIEFLKCRIHDKTATYSYDIAKRRN
uniref:MFS domain-containing protein n=1 Tax=Angiostrongylus cantonensis TaxID=6313 RepID=A0A0K0D3X5_ANGCA